MQRESKILDLKNIKKEYKERNIKKEYKKSNNKKKG